MYLPVYNNLYQQTTKRNLHLNKGQIYISYIIFKIMFMQLHAYACCIISYYKLYLQCKAIIQGLKIYNFLI